VIELSSVGLLLRAAKELATWGSSAHTDEREQIIRFLNGLKDRLQLIASVIKGTSEDSLARLCADLEEYGRLGDAQLSAILGKASLIQVGESAGKVAHDIREKNRAGWTPEKSRDALQDLDGGIGKLSGMVGFLTDFSGKKSAAGGKLVRWVKAASIKSAATFAGSALVAVAAKAASHLPGRTGDKAADYLDGLKSNLSDVADGAAEVVDSQ
jgi:hypothetical protein